MSKLKPCKDCSAKVSTAAKFCPSCGRSQLHMLTTGNLLLDITCLAICIGVLAFLF